MWHHNEKTKKTKQKQYSNTEGAACDNNILYSSYVWASGQTEAITHKNNKRSLPKFCQNYVAKILWSDQKSYFNNF